MSEAYLEVQGTDLKWEYNGNLYSITGRAVEPVEGTPGSIWIEGDHLAYIDEYGNKRLYYLDPLGVYPEGAIPGAFFIHPEDSLIRAVSSKKEVVKSIHYDHDDDAPGSRHSDSIGHDDLLEIHELHEDVYMYPHEWSNYEDQAPALHSDEPTEHNNKQYTDWNDHFNATHQDSLYNEWTNYAAGTYTDEPYFQWDDYDDDHSNRSYSDRSSYADEDYNDWPDHTNMVGPPYGDYTAHGDAAHSNWADHSDTPHSDDHDDYNVHYDVPHFDEPHRDEIIHTDIDHGDAGHWDYDVHNVTPYGDHTDHLDWNDGDHSDWPDHSDYVISHFDVSYYDHEDWVDESHSNWSDYRDIPHADTPKIEHWDS